MHVTAPNFLSTSNIISTIIYQRIDVIDCKVFCQSTKVSWPLAGGAVTRREQPDRFSAKCRRVLHAAIMVEIYVANISRGHPFSPRTRPLRRRIWNVRVHQRRVAVVIGSHMAAARYFKLHGKMEIRTASYRHWNTFPRKFRKVPRNISKIKYIEPSISNRRHDRLLRRK